MISTVRDLFSGAAILLRGAGIVLRRPKLFFLGAIPPLFTSLLFVAALVALLANIDDLSAWITPFADGWDEGWRATMRVTAGVVLVAGTVLLMVVGFTGLTLALGAPLYDLIAEAVEDELGDAPPESEEPLISSMARSIRQSLVIVAITALVSLPLLLAGFIPVVGQTVIPVVSALFGGWMLGMELVGTAFDRRGLIRLGDRRRAMAGHKALSLGFAVPCYLLLAVPFVAVLVFPAATAGGTILTRRLVPASRPSGPAAPPHPGGPYGAPPQGPYGGPPQDPYGGPPQGPYNGPAQGPQGPYGGPGAPRGGPYGPR
ncbi:EI24 domain-containing protein [Nocardiopsis potens]|uniref:EI24 domain-containing protein n=1 Tax=Nocardiopsis potens TaxID=1246458 RepID=UPI00034A6424|nr:EI24 domain-containing protein [Nocardiopsis potens]